MSVDENKAVTRRLMDELWNKGNVDIIDELMSEDLVQHPGGGTRERLKQNVAQNLANCPEVSITLEDVIAEGDMVAFRWTMRGPHSWEFAGIAPTGKMLTRTGINIQRIADGKIAEAWCQIDQLGFYKQLGCTPDMEQVQESTWD